MLVQRKKNVYRQKRIQSCSSACSCIQHPQFLSVGPLGVNLLLKNSFFFRKAVLRKLFDIRFLYENRDKVYSKTNHQSKVAELKSLLFGASKIDMKNG